MSNPIKLVGQYDEHSIGVLFAFSLASKLIIFQPFPPDHRLAWPTLNFQPLSR